jgi:hypothetical protein
MYNPNRRARRMIGFTSISAKEKQWRLRLNGLPLASRSGITAPTEISPVAFSSVWNWRTRASAWVWECPIAVRVKSIWLMSFQDFAIFMTTGDALYGTVAIRSVARVQHNAVELPHETAPKLRNRLRDKDLDRNYAGTCNAFTSGRAGRAGMAPWLATPRFSVSDLSIARGPPAASTIHNSSPCQFSLSLS